MPASHRRQPRWRRPPSSSARQTPSRPLADSRPLAQPTADSRPLAPAPSSHPSPPADSRPLAQPTADSRPLAPPSSHPRSPPSSHPRSPPSSPPRPASPNVFLHLRPRPRSRSRTERRLDGHRSKHRLPAKPHAKRRHSAGRFQKPALPTPPSGNERYLRTGPPRRRRHLPQ